MVSQEALTGAIYIDGRNVDITLTPLEREAARCLAGDFEAEMGDSSNAGITSTRNDGWCEDGYYERVRYAITLMKKGSGWTSARTRGVLLSLHEKHVIALDGDVDGGGAGFYYDGGALRTLSSKRAGE